MLHQARPPAQKTPVVVISVSKNEDKGRHNTLQAAALDYAKHGLYVVPLHEPIFNEAGECTGCTCEAYKHSKKYFEWLRAKGREKQFDPNFKCRTPGKHPRLGDWETQASNDPGQIKAWWKKWPTANIGLAVGKSGLVTFDLDTYKEIYGDDSDLFSLEDKQTVTQISGRGGEHLFYQMPAGESYTNANNTLPPGIDFRAVGGMVVLAPSIHQCGKQYEWEEGFSILDFEVKPLPYGLRAILDQAKQKCARVSEIRFTATTTEKPDLIRWKLSNTVRELINNPAPVGQRSEADMKVVTALCYAGASDDDILAVFEHYPIGTEGKFAEAGSVYLAHTIGKARTYVDMHPRPDVNKTINAVRLWVRTHSFDAFVPVESKTEYTNPATAETALVYRTDSTDTKVADAVLDVMEDAQRLTVNIGKKRLAKLAGLGSPNTALKALERLNGWLFRVTPDPKGAVVELMEDRRFQQNDPYKECDNRDQSTQNDNPTPEVNEYSPHKADDSFLTGTSHLIMRRIRNLVEALEISPEQAKADYTLSALGEKALRLIDAHIRCGDMTASAASEETGMKLSSVRSAYRKLEEQGLVEAEREGSRGPKMYSLIPDPWAKIEELRPNMRTYTLSAQRENKSLRDAQWKALRDKKTAQTQVEKDKLDRRIAKLGKRRVTLIAACYEDKHLTAADIERIAYDVQAPFTAHPVVQAKLGQFHAKARMDLAAERREVEWQLTDTCYDLHLDDVQKRDAVRMLLDAGYTKREVWPVVNRVWGRSRSYSRNIVLDSNCPY